METQPDPGIDPGIDPGMTDPGMTDPGMIGLRKPSVERMSGGGTSKPPEKRGSIFEKPPIFLKRSEKQSSGITGLEKPSPGSALSTVSGSTRRKKSGLGDVPDRSRLSVASVSSRAPSAMRKEPRDRKLSTNKNDDNVFKFVYSEAVENALRSYVYKSSAFPPLSGATATRRSEPNLPATEIVKLPELYTDLVTFRRTRKKNLAREQSFRAKHNWYRRNSSLTSASPSTGEDLQLGKGSKVQMKKNLSDALAAFKARGGGDKSSSVGTGSGFKLPGIISKLKSQAANVSSSSPGATEGSSSQSVFTQPSSVSSVSTS